MSVISTGNVPGLRYIDLLVVFGAASAAYTASNGYIKSEQGKPPDLVLEIACRHLAGSRLRDYAALGNTGTPTK